MIIPDFLRIYLLYFCAFLYAPEIAVRTTIERVLVSRVLGLSFPDTLCPVFPCAHCSSVPAVLLCFPLCPLLLSASAGSSLRLLPLCMLMFRDVTGWSSLAHRPTGRANNTSFLAIKQQNFFLSKWRVIFRMH